MERLKLDLGDLRVETFRTAASEEQLRGTVDAHMVSNGANTCYCTSKNIGCFCTEQC